MGKRKARKKPTTKEKPKLATSFDCPFCDHSGTVEVKMNYKKGHATLTCGVCSTGYSMQISSLDDPVDVYHEWIDKCKLVNSEEVEGAGHHVEVGSELGVLDTQLLGNNDEDDYDENEFIVNDDENQEADFDPKRRKYE
eukprot:NODE_10381_length_520_cov_16.256927_g9733_i0.p1 GENE.NODE_10381_length_520_cov_16.256927_g9733_i0~~NODE_10381_length_520_cov_16.256927_g9733_i0.p1  ORF type:complete len:139 (-),score=36.44 NODE_10381_length_520_cov_16.256927_g9733_i0:48-464(-)